MKMQDVNFRDVEEMIEYLPKEEQEITEVLRSLCLECLHGAREKLSYNVPFYSKKKRIAYIWPGSVKWGNVAMEGVQLGLCYGHLVPDELQYFKADQRKYVRIHTFHSLSDIDTDIIRHYLFEALALDDSF